MLINVYRPENGGLPCRGSDHRYRTCFAEQCGNVQKTTIQNFADQICLRAREVDSELLGTGLQRISSDCELLIKFAIQTINGEMTLTTVSEGGCTVLKQT